MPRPLKSQNQQDQSARTRVLQAATNLFTRKGYAATTTREIVQAAGVTKPILYYYFGNKEGIYLEILKETQRGFESLLEEALQQEGTAKEKILAFGRESCRRFWAHLEEARLIHALYFGPQQGAPHYDFEIFHTKMEQALRHLVRTGIQNGEFEPGQEDCLTWAILGAINFANDMQLIESSRVDGEACLGSVLGFIFNHDPVPTKKVQKTGLAGKNLRPRKRRGRDDRKNC